MAIRLSITWHGGTFRGRAADPTRTCWPPSPARMVGALLAGAHNLDGQDRDAARDAIGALTALPNPLIVTGAQPVELADNLQWFTPRNAGMPDDDKNHATGGIKAFLDAMPGVDAINRTTKARTASLLPGAYQMAYLIDGELGGAQVEALRSAAAEVPYFGASTDQATVTVEVAVASAGELADELCWEGLCVWEPSAGGTPIRAWTPDTVAFYDDRFECGGTKVDADPRVPLTGYRPRSRAEKPAKWPLLIRALAEGPAVIGDWPQLLGSVRERVSGLDVAVFPAVDMSRANRVLGIIFTGGDRARGVSACSGLLDPVADSAHVTLQPRTWSGPATVWESVTGMVAHRDAFIARGEAELICADAGLSLVDLSSQPWRRGQGTVPGVGRQYRQWFIRAASDEPTAGPISVGRFAETGAGLLAPAGRERK